MAVKSKTKTKKVRKKMDPAKLEQRRFTRLVRATFSNMGFSYIATENINAKFGNKNGEIDSVFLYENIILIVEDTASSDPFDHAKNKSLLAKEIV